MLNIAFTGARRLGLDCLRWLVEHPDTNVKCAYTQNTPGWWTDCDDRTEQRELGVPVCHPIAFKFMHDLDLVISVLNSYLFTPLDLTAYDAVNLHPAPLPAYRGCNSYSHAIMNGATHYGVTLHYVDAGIDTGPIIATGDVWVDETDTAKRLYDRAQHAALETFTSVMPLVINHHRNGERAPHREQQGPARYYPRSSLNDKRTHPYDEARIRALDFPPFPPAHLTTDVPEGHGRCN